MGYEAQKTNRLRDADFFRTYFSGSVLDIGCGPDLVIPSAQPFDQDHGDANQIRDYFPAETFDTVHSSHCLEHMRDVRAALLQWWSLVKPGGYLVLVVPDENLYEQGYWPSLFNSDHKSTFRLDGHGSWSPASYECRALLGELPLAEIVDIRVQDAGYDHRLLRLPHGVLGKVQRFVGRSLLWLSHRRRFLFHRLRIRAPGIEQFFGRIEWRLGKPVAQTDGEAVAQIQAIVRKRAG